MKNGIREDRAKQTIVLGVIAVVQVATALWPGR